VPIKPVIFSTLELKVLLARPKSAIFIVGLSEGFSILYSNNKLIKNYFQIKNYKNLSSELIKNINI